jgi:hypothetical protein
VLVLTVTDVIGAVAMFMLELGRQPGPHDRQALFFRPCNADRLLPDAEPVTPAAWSTCCSNCGRRRGGRSAGAIAASSEQRPQGRRRNYLLNHPTGGWSNAGPADSNLDCPHL